MFAKLKIRLGEFKLSLRAKLVLALTAIAVVLLAASLISILEYRRMSGYVSGTMDVNIENIRATQRMVDALDSYHLSILSTIGEKNPELPQADQSAFIAYCDSLKNDFGTQLPLADSVIYAYSAYMLTALELGEVMESNFVDTRDWYFSRLQPVFFRTRTYLDRMGQAMYETLRVNSREYDRGFSRSIIPGITAILVGILLVFLLLFYLMVYYVKPIYGMLQALEEFLSYRRRYVFDFESSDQMGQLNQRITELTEENRQVRKRLSELKDRTSSSTRHES